MTRRISFKAAAPCALAVFSMLAAISCAQEPQGSLNLSTESSVMDSAGGVIDLTVESNYRWTCNTGTTDIIISQKSGDAGVSGITVTVPGNPGSDDREILVKFNCENAKAVLTVNQSGAAFDTLTICHGASLFPGIVFEGTGYTGTVNWGDGKSQNYSYYNPMPTHEYEKASDYTVTVTTHDSDVFEMESMREITRIDLTKF